ncbi:hypothetical protein HYU10_04035 [Candidatus Woesearchaeota archaeon]|nr:hypothetical protein [Candidatus Woesearchaeota archaeon]MBI2130911.1 hypothetical protein [Candidatus Woesearchaeota archaeon]MBI2660919.1 hypothetical protein [Candidatus Woesearchaeota archaeon]
MIELNKEQKLKLLNESLESGSITKEEHDKGLEELDRQEEDINSSAAPEMPEQGKGSDKALLTSIAIVIVLFAAIFSFSYFKDEPKTIEELHAANFKNKLRPEQGYVYKGIYSFINLDGFWFTQIKSQTGKTIYDLSMRYSPRELENISLNGALNDTLFNEAKEYYVTFNPNGSDFSHIAVAAGDFNTHMLNAFAKAPIAACDRNDSDACAGRPVITCENTKDMIVLYIKEDEDFGVNYDGNCILVEGNGFDVVRGVDRILYNFYGMMGQ